MIDVYANIEAGKYENILPYPSGKSSNPNTRQAREAYTEESRMLKEVFYRDCCADLGLNPDRQSAEKIFSRAWEESHSSGWNEVYENMCELADFVQEMIDLRRAED